MSETRQSKHFRCDCGWAYHSLFVEPDEPGWPFAIQVVNAPRDITFRQRVKMAWDVIRGDEHVLSEIYLHREDMQSFVTYISELVASPGVSNSNCTVTPAADKASAESPGAGE